MCAGAGAVPPVDPVGGQYRGNPRRPPESRGVAIRCRECGRRAPLRRDARGGYICEPCFERAKIWGGPDGGRA
jgi:hypothetical protein